MPENELESRPNPLASILFAGAPQGNVLERMMPLQPSSLEARSDSALGPLLPPAFRAPGQGSAVANVMGTLLGRLARAPYDLPKGAVEEARRVAGGAGDYDPAPVMDATTALFGGGLPGAERGALGALSGRLTSPDKVAIGNYSGNHALAGNMLLRQGPEAFAREYGYMGSYFPKQVQKTIDNFDALAKRSTLDADTTLYRGMPVGPGVKPGDVLHDPGFMSTARTHGVPSQIAEQNGGKLVEIRAPKGANAIELGEHGMEKGEVVLPRGSKIKVVEVRPDRIIADLVSSDARK